MQGLARIIVLFSPYQPLLASDASPQRYPEDHFTPLQGRWQPQRHRKLVCVLRRLQGTIVGFCCNV